MLALTEDGPGRYLVTQPAEPAEGRDVVFSGQLLGQTIMAAAASAPGKEVRAVHAIFARAGTYTKPIVLEVDPMHAGRTWASDTVTAVQDGRLLCRSLVLLHTAEPDLMRHAPPMPAEVPPPDQLEDGPGQVFPGGKLRPVPGERTADGVPLHLVWHRFPGPLGPQAAHQAVLTWSTCGVIIGLAMRPHRDTVKIEEAHLKLSTGVIGHSIHFVEPLDATRWHLVVTEGTQAAGGRIYGSGSVFTEDGRLVATFQQDAMAKAAEHTLDPRRSM
ncbi:MAG TPA: acyl-CoA thioesterase domain-containing protein [Acidimicrobiales bacterium]|nr:acyl-CoA thioesterase domain-containing protein [Acidimicrobiales bacterium]